MNRRRLCAAALMGSMSLAFGSAFQIQEQSAALLGTAFNGSTVLGQDASTAFYNPAALVNIKNKQVSFSSIALNASTTMHTQISEANLGTATTGRDDNPGALMAIPGAYFASRLDERTVFGIGATVPFGLATHYSDDSYVRYIATDSEFQAIDLTPNLGFQWNERLAIGGGLDILFMETTLGMHVDGANAGTPQTDSISHNHGKDWGYSIHAGFIYHADRWALGAAYHAPIRVQKEGTSVSTFTGVEQGLTAETTLPEWAAISGRYWLNKDTSFLSELAWTRWERIQFLQLDFANQTSMILPLYFNNVWRAGLGLTHQWNERWLLRAGGAFEQSPVNTEHRTPRIPDTDRLWLGLGARYHMSKALTLDLAYGHIFFQKADIDDGSPLSGVTREALFPLLRYKGKFQGNVDLVGLQLSWDYV